jgi:ubiquinone/menaquinone biosynthesis C-methylase UbiE
MGTRDYHLQELSIATDPRDPRRAMPPVGPGHRRILDVGCGAGQTLIASNLESGVLAVGVDVDHTVLSLGKRLSDTVQFVRGSGEALPFKDECFDLVICRVALPYMHVYTALAEMCRVLRGGGDLWLVLHPFGMTAKELTTNMARFQIRGAIYRMWVLTNGLTLHAFGRQWALPFKGGRYESWQTRRGITRALKAAGFERVEISLGRHFVVTAMKIRPGSDDHAEAVPKNYFGKGMA